VKITSLRRINKEDIAKAGEVPSWLDALISPLNDFLDQVTSALRNRLTFEDNFQCAVKTIKVYSGVESEVSTGSRLSVRGVQVLDGGEEIISSFGFRRLTNGNLGITVNFLTAADAEVTFLISLR
jgi:hypothetical protein